MLYFRKLQHGKDTGPKKRQLWTTGFPIKFRKAKHLLLYGVTKDICIRIRPSIRSVDRPCVNRITGKLNDIFNLFSEMKTLGSCAHHVLRLAQTVKGNRLKS